MNTDAFDTLRAMRNTQAKKTSPRAWAPPTRELFGYGRILAFDQSLSACGVTVLTSNEHGITIREAHVMQTPASDAKSGREHNLRRALLLMDEITNWYRRTLPDPNWSVVYEAVPEGGNIRSPESSLLGAMAVLVASRSFPGQTVLLEPVMAQAHKQFVCGNRNAKKAEHHAALIPLARTLGVHGVELLTNEDKRDAFSVGLYALAHVHG